MGAAERVSRRQIAVGIHEARKSVGDALDIINTLGTQLEDAQQDIRDIKTQQAALAQTVSELGRALAAVDRSLTALAFFRAKHDGAWPRLRWLLTGRTA